MSDPEVTRTVDTAVGAGAVETVARRRPRVAWSDESGSHEQAILTTTRVGTAPSADLVLHEPTVSRLHAELEPSDDGLWVRDLGSRNGTYIRDVRIERGRVPKGGTVKLGTLELRVTYEAVPLTVPTWKEERFGPLLGRSPVMRRLFARLSRIAPTESSVLVHGETGTGKELVARAIHDASSRSSGPFIVVDCAALPENLLEAELFGHAKGAFTGANSSRDGALEVARGGTVFLDEVGELPLPVQPKLLRALESREIRPLGTSEHRDIDVRFVSATHRDLRTMVNDGTFREDLYFRLAVLVVQTPPLRERLEDVPLLVEHLAAGRDNALAADEQLMSELQSRAWLGNVRELRNVLERVHALGAADGLAMTESVEGKAAAEQRVPVSFAGAYKDVRQRWLSYLERAYFAELLEQHDRDVRATAEAAGVDRTYVYRLIRRHDL